MLIAKMREVSLNSCTYGVLSKYELYTVDTNSIDPLHLLALDTNPRECAIPFSLAHMHVLFLIRYGYPSAFCFRFFYSDSTLVEEGSF
jgi:hypothetical protein